MDADNERIMNGEKPGDESANTVKDVPENFKKWVTDNADRIEKANNRGTLPYFLKDNATFAGISENMNTKRYTPEEFALVKETAKNTLDYGRKNIIGKYEFNDSVFGGVSAKFTRNSFLENLRSIFQELLACICICENYRADGNRN